MRLEESREGRKEGPWRKGGIKERHVWEEKKGGARGGEEGGANGEMNGYFAPRIEYNRQNQRK